MKGTSCADVRDRVANVQVKHLFGWELGWTLLVNSGHAGLVT